MTIFETVKGWFIAEKAPNPTSKIVKSYGNYQDHPDVAFSKLIEYHDKTPQIQIGVTGYAELVTGTELQINADDEKAKEFIEEWCQQTNFYDKLESIVSTLLICGNALLEKLDEKFIEDVSEVDMSSIIDKKRDEYGETLYYVQQQRAGPVHIGEGQLDKFIEFNLTQYSKSAWGKSLFYSLAVPRSVRNRHYLPLVEILWAIEDAMGAIILNNAYPMTMFTFEGVSDSELEKEAEKIKKFKPGDKFVQTRKPEVDIFETQPNSKYTDYIAHIEKAIQLGIKFPHDIMTGDFTSRASSDTTEDLTLKLARGFQRYICNKLKQELFDPILLQNGFDPDKANLAPSFATQNIIQLTPEQVKDRVAAKQWSRAEGREWDKENLGADLFDKTFDAEPVEMQPEPQNDPDIGKKIESIENNLLTIRDVIDKKIRSETAKESIKTELEKIQSKIDSSIIGDSAKKDEMHARKIAILEKAARELGK